MLELVCEVTFVGVHVYVFGPLIWFGCVKPNKEKFQRWNLSLGA